MNSSLGLVLLAAGSSSRMGTPKQLLTYNGNSLLSRAIDAAVESVCRPVVVVLGANAEDVAKECDGRPITCIINHVWAEGISSSIRCGIETVQQIAPEVEGVVIMLCDQPGVGVEIIDALVQQHTDHASALVACQYQGSLGVPALFHRSFLSELTGLSGDHGAKKILMANKKVVDLIEFEPGAMDIDTPEEYNELHLS